MSSIHRVIPADAKQLELLADIIPRETTVIEFAGSEVSNVEAKPTGIDFEEFSDHLRLAEVMPVEKLSDEVKRRGAQINGTGIEEDVADFENPARLVALHD